MTPHDVAFIFALFLITNLNITVCVAILSLQIRRQLDKPTAERTAKPEEE